MNTPMMIAWIATNRVLKLATRLMLRMLIRLMMVTKPTTQAQAGTSGNITDR
ncbi:hypothetical protein D3C75_1318830 [compost metagenome]